jgi:hypothetical protein
MSPRTLDLLLAAYLAVCALCIVWPGMAVLGARVEPYVLGLPFALAWMVGWIVATFGVLAVYHVLRERSDA